MKKISVLCLIVILIFCFSGCYEEKTPKERTSIPAAEKTETPNETKYTSKDFYIYNKKGYTLATPFENGSCDLISCQEKYMNNPIDEYTFPITSKNISIGDEAVSALKKYNLCFGYSIYSFNRIDTFDVYNKNEISSEFFNIKEDTDLEKLFSENPESYISIFLNQNFYPINILSKEEISSKWIYKIEFRIKYKTVYNVTFSITETD